MANVMRIDEFANGTYNMQIRKRVDKIIAEIKELDKTSPFRYYFDHEEGIQPKWFEKMASGEDESLRSTFYLMVDAARGFHNMEYTLRVLSEYAENCEYVVDGSVEDYLLDFVESVLETAKKTNLQKAQNESYMPVGRKEKNEYGQYVLLKYTEDFYRHEMYENKLGLVTGDSILDIVNKTVADRESKGNIKAKDLTYDIDGNAIYVEYYKDGYDGDYFIHKFWFAKIGELTPADLKKEGIRQKRKNRGTIEM